jgi:predicted nucleotidyltransferase
MTAALEPDGPIMKCLKKNLPDLMAVYAFGSQVSGTSNDQSDLDLAVLVPGYVSSDFLWKLSSDLSQLVNCAVDLLDFRVASTVMQSQILNTGKRLWAKDMSASLYECFVLNEKNALDEARAPLIALIEKDGHVYGR